MYKITDGDGREYGPVTAEQMRAWIAEGRVSAETKAQTEGSSDWKPLSTFPEFADLLASVPAATMSAPATPAAARSPARISIMAVVSLVLGCSGFICLIFASLAGLILGISSLNQINRSGGALTGKGLAIAGIYVSGAMLVWNLLSIGGILLPALNEAREKARRATCMSNLKQIGISLYLYSQDNKGRFPTDAAWSTLGSYGLLTSKYQTSYETWVCPSDAGIVPGSSFASLTAKNVSYAYNGFGLTEAVQPDTPIAADRSSGDIRSSKPFAGNTWTHKSDGGNVLFADGHVAFQKTFIPPMYNGKNP